MSRLRSHLPCLFLLVFVACGDDEGNSTGPNDAADAGQDVLEDASPDLPDVVPDTDQDDAAVGDDVCTSDCADLPEQRYTLQGAVEPTVTFDGGLEFSRTAGEARCTIRWPMTSQAAVRTCEVCDWAFVLDIASGEIVENLGDECLAAGVVPTTWEGRILSVGYGGGQAWFDVDGEWVAGPGMTTFGDENGRQTFRYVGEELP